MNEAATLSSDVAAAVEPGLAGRDLTLGYRGSPVVEAASIRVAPGCVTALVGPNGSGKSTLLRALARLHAPAAGEVDVDGRPALQALSAKEFARHVTLLAQARPTPGGVAVRDVVGYGRHPHRRRWTGHDPEGADAVAWAMGVTGVAAMADRWVGDLSGGERQRVWLAACLAQRTGYLLLDEPTTYLDLRYQIETLDLVRDLASEHGVGVGVVLHDLQQAADVADEVVLLDRGQVVATGAPAAVLTSQRLTPVYGIEVEVVLDAGSGRVAVRAVGRHHRAT